jgi:hypothetical protein
MCFVHTLEHTAIISLYNINRLIFMIEKESVYCAVRAERLGIVHFNLSESYTFSFLRVSIILLFSLAL